MRDERPMTLDLGLLVLRLGAGPLMMGHGLGKVADLFAGKTDFPDPLGIGSVPSLVLAGFAELFCALAVAVGYKTRLAAVPVVITMLVAAFVFHWSDGWADKEFPLLYALAFLTLSLTGPGRFSLDRLSRRRR